jgi:hypothetical protein
MKAISAYFATIADAIRTSPQPRPCFCRSATDEKKARIAVLFGYHSDGLIKIVPSGNFTGSGN